MHLMAKSIVRVLSVWKRQSRNWRTVSIVSLFNKFFQRMTQTYTPIYIKQLGANDIQLGIVNSISNIVATGISAPVGWLQDRYSLKKIFIIGFIVSLISTIVYGAATAWTTIIFAMGLSALVALRTSGAPAIGSCQTICDVSVNVDDRATCKGFCDGFFALPSLITPMLAAILITYFGGSSQPTAEGIRPLFWLQAAAYVVIIIVLVTQLTEIARPKSKSQGFLKDYREVFRTGTALKRWLIYSVVDSFVMTMANPYQTIYANEVKMANTFILGAMTTGTLLTPTLLSAFFGNIADKRGRKKLLFILLPIWWVSQVLLLFAPVGGDGTILVLASLLAGFRQIAGYTITAALMIDLVPIENIGRWRGILGLANGLAAIPAPIIGGIIYQTIGPSYLIIIPVIIDITLRLPILQTIPEKPRSQKKFETS